MLFRVPLATVSWFGMITVLVGFPLFIYLIWLPFCDLYSNPKASSFFYDFARLKDRIFIAHYTATSRVVTKAGEANTSGSLSS
jgi:hypothetical protein